MDPAVARAEALRAAGARETAHSSAERRERRLAFVEHLEEIAADVRYGFRGLLKSPALTGAAILTLALTIGANTAIFSAVNAVVLRPLPFPNADRLMMLWESNPEYGWDQQTAAPANVLDWREQVKAFDDVAWYAGGTGTVTLSGHGRPQPISVASVSGNLFSVLGVRPPLGRALEDGESWNTGPRVAVISDRLWRDRLGADPSVVGRSIMLNGRPWMVVGVAPASFAYPSDGIDAWLPSRFDPAYRGQVFFRRAHYVRAIARLKPHVTHSEANAELQVVARRLQAQYPETNRVMGAGMTPLHDFLIKESKRPILMLFAAGALLVLIACANIGNLLLVREAGRQRESALRLALGAGCARLVRSAIVESLLLSLLGGAAGLAIGFWGTRALGSLLPAGLLPVGRITPDVHVLGYAFALMLATGLLFGFAPAASEASLHPGEALKEGSHGTTSGRTRRWGERLVAAEVAVAVLLAVGAGLLVRTWFALERVNPGFDGRGVLAVSLDASGPTYDSDAKQIGFYDQLLTRVRALPGVTAAALTSQPPLTDWGWTSQFVAERWPAGKWSPDVAHREVSPGYFATMHVPVLRGRDFGPQEGQNSPLVALINATLARRYFPNEDPIGRRVAYDKTPDSTSHWRTIIGVVGDEHQTQLGAETKEQFIEPFAQETRPNMTLILRARGDPLPLLPSVRNVLASLDPTLAIIKAQPMAAIEAESMARQRFLLTMLVAFAAVGFVLAMVGVYGVAAQLARSRNREMGIRIALVAREDQVQWLVLRHVLRVIAGV